VNAQDVKRVFVKYVMIVKKMIIKVSQDVNVLTNRIQKGILTASKIMGNDNLYGKTITNLRNAIQDEQKEYRKGDE
jgi:hypothetical protein